MGAGWPKDAEMKLEELTGYRLKIEERGGRRLQDILHKSNPWEGVDCERQKCLPCETKNRTGKFSTQSCSKRSSVYETWCANCEEKSSRDKVVEHGSSSCKPVREITLYKYIGETARSTHERGLEHIGDALNLNYKSHILKHYVDSHMGEDWDNIRFNMKVVKFSRTSFERQIYESVLIQENRAHNLLNSKSEFNRCSIPRLTLKMGDKELKTTTRENEERGRVNGKD